MYKIFPIIFLYSTSILCVTSAYVSVAIVPIAKGKFVFNR